MAEEDDALTKQLNLRVSPNDLKALDDLAVPEVIAAGTVARVAMRLGIEQLKRDPGLLLKAARQDKAAKQEKGGKAK